MWKGKCQSKAPFLWNKFANSKAPPVHLIACLFTRMNIVWVELNIKFGSSAVVFIAFDISDFHISLLFTLSGWNQPWMPKFCFNFLSCPFSRCFRLNCMGVLRSKAHFASCILFLFRFFPNPLDKFILNTCRFFCHCHEISKHSAVALALARHSTSNVRCQI